MFLVERGKVAGYSISLLASFIALTTVFLHLVAMLVPTSRLRLKLLRQVNPVALPLGLLLLHLLLKVIVPLTQPYKLLILLVELLLPRLALFPKLTN